MLNNKTFYPTPPDLAARMVAKINCKEIPAHSLKILEPSAGKGDLIEALTKERWRNEFRDISAIESDPDLRATLIGKRIKVIDTDFLSFSGPDKFDLIIANPPFDDGDKHLLKAIDILYTGQIIFLLNAETIRNPYTNTRKELMKKLKELNAEIEYISEAFKNAERPTGVEVALVNIIVDRKVEDDLFAGADDKADDPKPEFKEKFEVSNRRHIEEMVAEYNQILKIGTETIIGYYQNYRKIGGFIGLNRERDKYHNGRGEGDLTGMMQGHLNQLIQDVRKHFWRKTLNLKEVKNRMTKKKLDEFEHAVNRQCDMDFTENNIRTFVLNVINGYEKTLTDAVLEIFHKFSEKHSWDPNNPDEENIHYFNGWKTNKAFRVNKKVIIPMGSYSYNSWDKGWKIDWNAIRELNDIDLVMNYFDGMDGYYLSMARAIQMDFEKGKSRNIESSYFTVSCYKKGTIHLTFNDENILRRFNVVACRGKNWLPCDYGAKAYEEMPAEEKAVVDSFEGAKSYEENRIQPLFGPKVEVNNALPEPEAQMRMFNVSHNNI